MALSLQTSLRIAARELRSSRGKFAFVVLSVAIGVAALTGVRGFSAAFRSMLLLRARSIMAADLSARLNVQPGAAEQAKLDAVALPGDRRTEVVELLSMASAPPQPDPLLVSLKAIDPAAYPFYGEVVLEPKMPLAQALTDSTVAVGDDLLLRLHLKVGDSIKLGERSFRIVATVEDEPDRLSGMFAAGPRVLLSQDALAQSGLMAYGSRAVRRYLFKLQSTLSEPTVSPAELQSRKAALEAALPEANVLDFSEANPALTRALDGATGLLSLMSLVALVLGAVGVAMAMRSHLAARMDSIAIMKSLGAGSGEIIRIYGLQTLLLGLAGGVLGVLLGMGVQLALPLFLARLLHLTPDFRLDAHAIGLGLGAGLLTTLLFTLPPLLDIRTIRPLLILRRAVADPFSGGLWSRLRSSGGQLAATLLILLALGWLAARVSDSSRLGWYFAAGLLAVLLALIGLSAALLKLLHLFLRGTSLRLPPTLRHGLANLYRPGNPSAALLAALGLGVMQMATVYIVQHSVVGEMQQSVRSRLPNLFLVDMSPDEAAGIKNLLKQRPEVTGDLEFVPVINARITAVDGVPAAQLRVEHMPRRALSSVNLTTEPAPGAPPPGDRVSTGQWWTPTQAASDTTVAVERRLAERLHVRTGSQITFFVDGRELPAHVAALYDPDSQHAYSRAEFVLPQAALATAPTVVYGGVHCEPAQTGVLRRAIYERYPTVTVIDVAQTLETVRTVLVQVTYVIEFLAGFSIFAGVVILAGAIAGTRYRRLREVVVLKTLGATRLRIAGIFSVEFAVLGLIAAAVGLLFANALGRLLLHRVLHFDYRPQAAVMAELWLATAALAVIAGWTASWRVLGQKPLEILREE